MDVKSFDDKSSSAFPVVLAYSFDYSQFDNPDLQIKARNTLGNFLGFVRNTFDGLLENGRALQSLYNECIADNPGGKKVFQAWLASGEFGSSRYVATSAIEIWTWFEKLPPKIQRLVRQNVQKWSVSALRQLTKVSNDIVKELVRTGKKTAQQVKETGGGEDKERGGNHFHSPTPELSQSPTPELVPGMRITIKNDDMGWNGHSGIIMSKQEENFWVLLDHTVAQGMEVKHLFKPHQIQPEVQQTVTKRASEEFFNAAQVEEKIASALAQRDREKAEEEQGRFIEIRDAALQAAKRELIAAEQHAQKMAQAKKALVEQLTAKEQELQSVRALQIKNQQLEQRVAELEKALIGASENNWGNTFNAQAAKVVNSDVEKTIAPLMAKVERLQNVVELKDKELIQLRAIGIKQQEELKALQQNIASALGGEEVITTFGEVGERLGWHGWGRRGYRSEDGTVHTGINALAAFISDLTHSDNLYPEVAF